MRPGTSWLLLASLLAGVAPPVQGQDEPLGRTAAFGPLDAGAIASVKAGTPLRSRPDPYAAVLLEVDVDVELQILERRGDWVRTSYGDRTGWLAPGGEADAELPALEAARQGELVLDTSPAEDAARIASARELLESENPAATSIGPWTLHTDVRDVELLALLSRVAAQLPSTYSRRFGLPISEPAIRQPVVLFASEERYRAFATGFTDIGDLHGGGHADGSMAAFFVGDSSATDVAATMVHELTHLLNRASFNRAPATWLEEGMANDLGFARIDSEGGLQVGTLGGENSVMTQRTSGRRVIVNTLQTGGRATWTQLLRDWRDRRSKLNPLGRLLDLPWSAFVDGPLRSSNYALSTFFVRYLLDFAAIERNAAFRGFVAAAAQGAATDSAALARALETDLQSLERDYERWLTLQVVAAR